MADNAAHATKTLEDLKQQLAAKLADAAKTLAAINVIEEMIGVARTQMPSMYQLDDSATFGGPSTSGKTTSIKADEYLGEEPVDAAKKYMRKVGHAVHIDEIGEAISKGGAAIRGADWKERLGNSLLRSTADVIKVQDKTFGLVDFYSPEQIARLRGTRRQTGKHNGPKKRRGRPPKKSPRALTPKPGITVVPDDKADEEIRAAV